MPLERPPDFEIEKKIDVPKSRLHAFLCDLHNYVPLHPFIESIVDLEPTPELPNALRYRVVDKIPLGPLRLPTVYVAALDPVSESEVHGHAWQSPGIRLHTVYSLESVDEASGETCLTERCRVLSAPRWMRGFVVRQAHKAHTETLSELKALLER